MAVMQTKQKLPAQPSYDNNQSLLYNCNLDPGRSSGYLGYVTGFISRNGIRFDPKVMGQDERERSSGTLRRRAAMS